MEEARAKFMSEALTQFTAMDANGDGSVDRAEALAFAKAQKGGDQPISEDDQQQLDKMFADMDTNADGKISKEEFEAGFGKMFDEFIAPMMQAMMGG